MVKLNPILSQVLIFITLVAAACCFVIGLNWSSNQSAHQMTTLKDSMPQESPLTPIIRHEMTSNPVGKEARESEIFPVSPKQNGIVQPPSLNPEIPGDNPTPPVEEVLREPPVDVSSSKITHQNQSATNSDVESPSLNLEMRGDNPTPPVEEALREQPLDGVSSQLTSGDQSAISFRVPTEFEAKIVKQVKLEGHSKAIALTFDDGPSPRNTLKVLDILKKNNIKATFFWVGLCVKAYPKIAQQVVADGNAIGNHTWHHWYHQMDRSTAANEIDSTEELIYKTTGVKTSLFRPPGGVLNNGVADYAKQKKYAIMMWSDDPMDYRSLSPQKLVSNVIQKAQPGGIVLLHDGGGNHAATVQALPQIITKLKALGYSFVTVPELLKMKDTQPSEVMATTQSSNPPLSLTTDH